MPLFKQKLHSSVFIESRYSCKEGVELLREFLAGQGNFNCAYVCAALTGFLFLVNWEELVCADADVFYLYVREESVPNHFSYVDSSADGSAACFNAYVFSSAVEEGDACEDIVHDWLFAN